MKSMIVMLSRSAMMAAAVVALPLLAAAPAAAQATDASKSLTKCQATAQKEAGKYAAAVQKALGGCLQRVAKQVVEGNQAVPEVSGAVGTCVSQLYRLGRSDDKSAGAKMEEKIRAACDPAHAGFRGAHGEDDVVDAGSLGVEQPLGAAAIDAYCGSFAAGSSTLAEWVECLRAAAECQGRQSAAVAFPRALEWLELVQAAIGVPDPSNAKRVEGLAAIEAARIAIDATPVDGSPDLVCGPAADATELVECEDDLTTCGDDLTTCDTTLVTCESDLTQTETELVECEEDLVAAELCGNGAIDAGEDCDLGTLNGATCVTEGFTGGVLSCANGCELDTSGCWAARFVDNADGTITDNQTGLTWEKKVQLGGGANLANLQDADNTYLWSGTCSVTTSKRCQPDAASSALCLADVEGNPDGCAECTGGEGTCTVASPGITIWQWLVDLNGASYGGHDDWRVATLQELQAIVDYTDGSPPAVNVAFHGASCGTGCTDVTSAACSCTRSFDYWSASTYAPSPFLAWLVNFNDGGVYAGNKSVINRSVRAVRGGS